MHQNTIKKISLLAFLVFALIACDTDEPTPTDKNYDYTCVLVNMGNYSESNGSIALYNENTGVVEQEVYTKANGRKLGAIIESAVLHNDLLLLMCNNSDKLVFLHSTTLKEVCEPISTIGVPRYAVVKGNCAYVSCWNKTNKQTGAVILPQHISKIDIPTKTVVASMPTNGQPEGMLLCGDTLFVASGNGIDVFNTTTDTLIKHISSSFIGAEAQQLVLDKNKQVWVSLGSYTNTAGFLIVNAATLEITAQLTEPKLSFEGDLALSADRGTVYFIQADGIVGGQTAEVPTYIYAVNATDFQVSTSPVCSGVGFYGLALQPSSDKLFTANVNGFITNSMTYIYTASGSKINEFMTGVGTCRFVFK
ncbi:MAG: hypothetical protein JXQ69_06615 [Paludibacteraceae bacterium]|nr:hypothetical protein [Paludibacteraceae bacterium]MBN2787979.1 hypothetical protein [Paludibacteraceae bacterium]